MYSLPHRLVLAVSTAAALLATVSSADAASRRYKSEYSDDTSGSYQSRSTTRQSYGYYNGDRSQRDSNDRTRAQENDPAGEYRAYPNWARAALSPQR